MQSLEHGFGMGFRDTQKGAGGAFGSAMALFPILEGSGADADESGELGLSESEFFANLFSIGPLQSGAASGFLFPAKDSTAFLEAGGELLEEFVFHGGLAMSAHCKAFSSSSGRSSFVCRVKERGFFEDEAHLKEYPSMTDFCQRGILRRPQGRNQ